MYLHHSPASALLSPLCFESLLCISCYTLVGPIGASEFIGNGHAVSVPKWQPDRSTFPVLCLELMSAHAMT